MLDRTDTDAAVAAARALSVPLRGRRWGHLSLNVLAAVFPRDVVARRYARAAGLRRVRVAGDLLPVAGEEPLDVFLRRTHEWGTDRLAADVLGDTGLTSTRGGIPRALAAVEYARVLDRHRVRTMADAADLLHMPVRATVAGRELSSVPGHGGGARLERLWRLLGDDHYVHLDDATRRWCRTVTGQDLTDRQTRVLITTAAAAVRRTPWELALAVSRPGVTGPRTRRGDVVPLVPRRHGTAG